MSNIYVCMSAPVVINDIFVSAKSPIVPLQNTGVTTNALLLSRLGLRRQDFTD